MKDRIAQVIYVIGCLGGGFFMAWAILGMVVMPFARGGRVEDMIETIFLLLVLSLGSYGAGWAVRYVINGKKTTVLDYVRK